MTDTLVWRRSEYCNSSACVEVAVTASGVLVRDSKHPDLPPLAFSHGAWNDFLEAVRAGNIPH